MYVCMYVDAISNSKTLWNSYKYNFFRFWHDILLTKLPTYKKTVFNESEECVFMDNSQVSFAYL